jgi:hypothetical protein
MRRQVAAGLTILVAGICAVLVALVGSASAEPPVVVMDSATNPTYTTVEVTGRVNPEGSLAYWDFQVSDDEGATWYGTNAGGGSEASTLEPVSGTIEEIYAPERAEAPRAGATYKVRLWAEHPGEPAVTSSELEFTTESLPAPTVTIDPVGATTDTTAELSGSITANSPSGDPAAADVKWRFVCSPFCATSDQGTVTAGQSESVQTTATGLEPNTEYTVTLIGENAGPPVSSSPVSFRTPVIAPVSETLSPNVLSGGTSAKLRGNIDPNNSPAEYWFEYGPTPAYGQIAPAGGRGDAGAGRGHVVSQEIGGLTPGTTYHYRLVAEGSGGRNAGSDVEFTTAPAAGQACPNEEIRRQQYTTRLPECRAYELVSPAEKEGSRVGPPAPNVINGARISPDGDAVLFSLSGPLARATSGSALYKASRSSSGWSSAQVALPQPAGISSLGVIHMPYVSQDLSTGMFLEAAAGSAEEFFTGVESLFLHGLQPEGFTTLLNPGQAPGFEGARARGQSKDLSHALFTSNSALTAEAPSGASSLYDYTNGGLNLVSILPDGQPDPAGAELGTNVPTYSRDPARFNAVSDDGSHIVFTALSDGQVYQRIDGTRTVEVSASHGGADPTGAFPAQFVAATTTGSKVFFISAGELTPDANTGGHTGKDLYEYDVAGDSLRDLTVDENPGDPAGASVLGLAGLADDGSVLYVAAEGVLAAGAVPGRANLYTVRPGGATAFVAPLVSGSLGSGDSGIWEGSLGGPQISTGQASPSGRYLAFSSDDRLTPDSVGGSNVYLYDADATAGPKLTCVSCGPGDAKGGEANVNALTGYISFDLETYQPHFVFDSGSVYFTTAAALLEADTNGRVDVYQYRHGALNLISSGRGNSDAGFADASPDGQDVLIWTGDPLLAADRDEAADYYEVRIGGGFSEPTAPPLCSGEGCRPPVAESRPASTPASSALQSNRSSADRSFTVGAISAKAVTKTGKLTLHVRTGSAGTITAKATARLGQRKRQIAKARRKVAKASSTTLVLRLSGAARRQLANSGRLKVTLRVTFSNAPKSSVRSLTLVSVKHPRKGR